MNRSFLIICILLFGAASVFADKPEWINRLPFTDDAFWGVGSASTLEDAQNLAKKEILMQLCSHVKAVVTMEERSDGGEYDINEDLDAYFDSNSLRGAEMEDQYEEAGSYWVLMKYCDECGKMLMNSALNRFEEKYSLEPAKLMNELEESNISEILEIEQRLKELNLEDYKSDDIFVTLTEKKMTVNIINFLPYETALSDSQQVGLAVLTSTLFEELKELNYNTLYIIGHANPTGEENEEKDLILLSKNRAETMSTFLIQSGFTVDGVSWKGGNEAVGDTSTLEGMGRNRRVEIVIEFE